MDKVLVVGTGGLARELTSWLSAHFDIVGYSSRDPSEHGRFDLPGALFSDEVSPKSVGADSAFLAIGTPLDRERLYEKYSNLGFVFPTFFHPSSVISTRARFGEGVVVSPNCVISPNVTVGKFVYVNFSCGIGHDAVVGDFVQINPGAQLGGFAKIGNYALVGSGSTVLQEVSVGAGATVGAGSVVFGTVKDGATVIGNPAKRMPAA